MNQSEFSNTRLPHRFHHLCSVGDSCDRDSIRIPHTYPLYNCYMTYVRKEIRPYYFRGKIVVAKLGEDGVIRILTKEGEFRESSLLKLKECRKFKTAKQAMVYIIEYVKPNENQQNDK